MLTDRQVLDLCVEGIRMLPADTDYYVRPMFFCRGGDILPQIGETAFALSVFEMPMPPEDAGRAPLSPFRRAGPDQAPSDGQPRERPTAVRGERGAIREDTRGR